MRSIKSYIGLSQIVGRSLPAEEIPPIFAKLGAGQTFKHLAAFAATLDNHEGGQSEAVQESLQIGIRELVSAEHPLMRAVGEALQKQRAPILIAHERLIYFMQALALHHGLDEGPDPKWGGMVFMMLACNDHLVEWVAGRDELEGIEKNIADMFVASRFDTSDAGMEAFIRGAWLAREAPRALEQSKQKLWTKLHETAFHGMTYDKYFESFLGPLALTSYRWGLGDNGIVAPSVNPKTWFSEIALDNHLAALFFEPLETTIDDIKSDLPLTTGGLPKNALAFAFKPLIRLGTEVWATSPKFVREQLRGGSWNRMRLACQTVMGDSEEWLRPFGHRFEEWCQLVAREASRVDAFADVLVASSADGKEEEICDVVLESSGRLALFEVKGTTVPAHTSIEFTDARKILRFFERFFFELPKGNRRGGVARQLDSRIKKIRAGEHSGRVPSTGQIFPCVVTYDNLGENGLLYRWIDGRCAEEGLLTDDLTAPITILAVDDFEKLMGAGANGASVVDLLKRKAAEPWREGRIDQILPPASDEAGARYIPMINKMYDEKHNARMPLSLAPRDGAVVEAATVRHHLEEGCFPVRFGTHYSLAHTWTSGGGAR